MNRLVYNFLFLGLLAFVSSCTPKPQAPVAGPVPVTLYDVKRQPAVYYDEFPGTVVALNQVELRSEVTGYIREILFKEGQVVRKGQRLYTIDQSRYGATHDQAQANVEIAQANLEKARRDADRYTKLSEQDAIARQRLDDALTDLQNKKLQLASAKADLVKAQTDLRYSVITAPFDGTIGISQVRLGTLVSPGQTLLNTISSDNPIAVDFVIDEKDLPRFVKFEQGTRAKQDTTFRIILPDDSTYPSYGAIDFIDRAVDPQTGTIKVRLSFTNNDRTLRAGMSCTVRVLNENAGNHIVIPYKAVTEQMGEYFTYIVERDSAFQRKVSLGARVNDHVIVRSGLQEGDHIVIEGIQKLRDKTPVQAGAPQPSAEVKKTK
jgi:membrane fusion protein (multidrug efflux system)